ncbi:MAG TPA: hypothetical protein VEJ84_08350 [Acidimicrobiales bacterium]|nr:hypothetical protein [Acidimicrobiales bacterium]
MSAIGIAASGAPGLAVLPCAQRVTIFSLLYRRRRGAALVAQPLTAVLGCSSMFG